VEETAAQVAALYEVIEAAVKARGTAKAEVAR
jgi:hypothetical protein